MSDIKLQYYSNVFNGKLQLNVSQLIAKELPEFEGKRVEITIKRLRSKRSLQQNRLWWLYVTIVSNELGYDKDEFHEIAKYKLLKREKVNEATGEVFTYIGSTAKLNKSEFADLVSDFQRWVSESFSIVLPQPGDMFELQFEP